MNNVHAYVHMYMNVLKIYNVYVESVGSSTVEKNET